MAIIEEAVPISMILLKLQYEYWVNLHNPIVLIDYIGALEVFT